MSEGKCDYESVVAVVKLHTCSVQELQSSFESSPAVVAAELSKGIRADLRHLRSITIDPPQAKELSVTLSSKQSVIDHPETDYHS